MSKVRLAEVTFNHDWNSATKDALSVRKNAAEPISYPEWHQDPGSSPPVRSSPAYAISEINGNTVTIRAKFTRSDPTIHTIEVRAIDPNREYYRSGQACIYYILERLGITPTVPPPPRDFNVLGEVKAKLINFSSTNVSLSEEFELENVTIESCGVGIYDVTWQWQYRTSFQEDSNWINMEVYEGKPFSHHRIYTILAIPTAPWVQTPHNPNLPWTEVLDYACIWAKNRKTIDDAACRVTQNVFNLGPEIIYYDCEGNGATNYALYGFHCTVFLERLRGGLGWGPEVNCSDCATIVSTFANILGCDLWQSEMGYDFYLRPLLAIGSDTWEPACGWVGFHYHEVAWKGACEGKDEIFDACLQIDLCPTEPCHCGVIPCDMCFNFYVRWLVPDSSVSSCRPRPTTRQRRDILG